MNLMMINQQKVLLTMKSIRSRLGKTGLVLAALAVLLFTASAASADPLQIIAQSGGFQLRQLGNNGIGVDPASVSSDVLIGSSASVSQILASGDGSFIAMINPLTFTQGFTGFGSEGVFAFTFSQALTINGQTQTLNILGSLTIGTLLDSVTIVSSEPLVFNFDTFSVTATILPTSIFPNANGEFPGSLSAQFTVTQNDAPSSAPEPASLLLLGAGLAGIAAKIRRRRSGKL